MKNQVKFNEAFELGEFGQEKIKNPAFDKNGNITKHGQKQADKGRLEYANSIDYSKAIPEAEAYLQKSIKAKNKQGIATAQGILNMLKRNQRIAI
jgi:hypothetical protein